MGGPGAFLGRGGQKKELEPGTDVKSGVEGDRGGWLGDLVETSQKVISLQTNFTTVLPVIGLVWE
jgi:hypothetical protein